uniref:Uncharacterized protein n=1 Tax=Nelumbo nucifera TaxID=4432 RepID=A0A822XJ18_NELNU|nr:TPA_asm: hypothetical protein HUJ06_020449 [Nelumbo nucifera]
MEQHSFCCWHSPFSMLAWIMSLLLRLQSLGSSSWIWDLPHVRRNAFILDLPHGSGFHVAVAFILLLLRAYLSRVGEPSLLYNERIRIPYLLGEGGVSRASSWPAYVNTT